VRVIVAASTVALVAIAAVVIVALIVFMYVVPRGGRRRRRSYRAVTEGKAGARWTDGDSHSETRRDSFESSTGFQ
jgi:hypothetical protein